MSYGFKAMLLFGFVSWTFGQIASNRICSVGELRNDTFSLCNANGGKDRCRAYCADVFSNEFLNSACVGGGGRSRGKSECICNIECLFAEIYGDPRFKSFNNGPQFEWHELCQYLAVAPIVKPRSLPNFELRLTNNFRGRSIEWGSYPETMNLILPDWAFILTINVADWSLSVNGKIRAVPYQYSKVNGHRRDFVSVTKTSDYMTVTTSFGLWIKIIGDRIIEIFVPKHTDLWRNLKGLLGGWHNDNKTTVADNNGIDRDLSVPGDDMVKYGNSFCIEPTKQKRSAPKFYNRFDNFEKKLQQCRQFRQRRIDELCGALNDAKLVDCLQNGELQHAKKECEADVCFAGIDHEAEAHAACTIIQAYAERCEIEGIPCGR